MSSTQYCEFCEIYQEKKELLIFQSETIMAFEDVDIASSQRHILVCPIKHISNVHSLNINHLSLLDEIQSIANQILLQSHGNREFRFGYHIPPYVSVDHLHLHGVVLPIRDMFFNLVKFGKLLHPPQEIKQMIEENNNNNIN